MKKLLKKGFVAAACAVTMLAGFGSANATDYDYIDLYTPSTLAGDYSYQGRGTYQSKAMGINDSGTVVGFLKGIYGYVQGGAMGTSQTHVISWDLASGGTATDLGTMGSANGTAFAYGISEAGQIAGSFRTKLGSQNVFKPYTYDLTGSTQTNLTTPLTSPTAEAMDINDSGQAVGWTSTSVGTTLTNMPKTAFISNPVDGTISYIPGAAVGTTATNGSEAYSINNSGLVTGYTTVDGNALAFLYDSSSDAFTTLGTLGGLTSKGTYVNESGAIVGYSTLADGVERAFLYSEGSMIDLGALGGEGTSQAYGLNEAGAVVGTSNGHAFVYSDGQMIDLNTLIDPALGVTLTMATDINNLGQIVGYGTALIDGVSMEAAFALTPVTPTPVPASVLLFGSGLAGLALVRRKKQA
jgi:probable HAF family extracellular repeat protein